MSDSNTIAGWVLGAGIVALGSSILFGEVFHSAPAHDGKQGYVIQGVEASGEGGGAVAEVPVATALAAAAAADGAAQGETIFKKCVSCHTINAGGANGIGPNLNAVMGRAIASSGFAYSPALKAKGGNWSFESMNEWLKSPKKFVPDNKMTFAGIGKPEERAALMLYLNSQGSNLPLPTPEAAPAEGTADAAAPAAAGDAAAAEAPKK